MLTVKHGIGAFLCKVQPGIKLHAESVSKLIYAIRTYDPLPKITREGFLEEIFLLGALLKVFTKTTSCMWLWLLFPSRVDK